MLAEKKGEKVVCLQGVRNLCKAKVVGLRVEDDGGTKENALSIEV